MSITQVGFGVTANIDPFELLDASPGIKRWGKNVISELQFSQTPVAPYWFRTAFDANGVDTFNDGGPTEFECGIAFYDSGGPSFITQGGIQKIIGIHHGASPAIGGTSADSVIKWAYETWIYWIINPANEPTP